MDNKIFTHDNFSTGMSITTVILVICFFIWMVYPYTNSIIKSVFVIIGAIAAIFAVLVIATIIGSFVNKIKNLDIWL